MSLDDFDRSMLDHARRVSLNSPDPSTKSGAVLVGRSGTILATGFNRLPCGMDPVRYAAWLSDRETKYRAIVHGERVAIAHARCDLRGATLYLWPFMTCAPCAGFVAETGVARVVAPASDAPRWQLDFAIAKEIYKENRIALELGPDAETLEALFSKAAAAFAAAG